MSTNDVPGANPSNNDVLAMGCWAEHDDGSLILVESTEGSRVVFSVFDLSKDPPVEYREAMAEDSFKSTFTWERGKTAKKSNEKWTWHDKTAFPWDRIIKRGLPDGQRFASADGLRTAAERVAESLKLHGIPLQSDAYAHRQDQEVPRPSRESHIIMDKISRALAELMK